MKRLLRFMLEVLIVVGVSTWVVFKAALLVLLIIDDVVSKGELPWLRNTGHLGADGRRQNCGL